MIRAEQSCYIVTILKVSQILQWCDSGILRWLKKAVFKTIVPLCVVLLTHDWTIEKNKWLLD